MPQLSMHSPIGDITISEERGEIVSIDRGKATVLVGSIRAKVPLHELVRADKEHALVTMCCGGGLGTGTIIERV